jgi:hypothetical protein
MAEPADPLPPSLARFAVWRWKRRAIIGMILAVYLTSMTPTAYMLTRFQGRPTRRLSHAVITTHFVVYYPAVVLCRIIPPIMWLQELQWFVLVETFGDPYAKWRSTQRNQKALPRP